MNSNANRPTTPNELLQNFPNLRKVKSLGKDNISVIKINKEAISLLRDIKLLN